MLPRKKSIDVILVLVIAVISKSIRLIGRYIWLRHLQNILQWQYKNYQLNRCNKTIEKSESAAVFKHR
jgi:hypothetical protein